ncbi:ABC transporter permease [Conexibacter arvalis]|uniref:Peptide/nickel transport system permease protein n=1 Tax=Conexibacter arvalis TaxID=912552 RepID=A0A840IB51_9ACTN|nr:ABC transporter permease [Conexibacter arvalis]MBB4661334.1 peptide/nickel transport system permease protein [Conexibacter arvalis]
MSVGRLEGAGQGPEIALHTADDLGPEPRPQGPRRGLRARAGRAGFFLTGWWALLLLFGLVAIFAPLIAPFDPVRADLTARLLPPSGTHLFGTDQNGMDVFSRVLWATRTDFTIAFVGVAISLAVGVPLGAASGYLGGWLDEGLNRFAEIIQSIPLFLFALMVFAAMGNNRTVLIGIVGFVNAPIFFKLTRAVVLPMKSLDYIAAATCAGLRAPAIIVRHVLPNALGPVASQLSISCAYALQIVAGLSFLGLGVPVPEPEWGSMIQQGAGRIVDGDWWISVFPGFAVLLAVMAFGGIGRQLARAYDH